MGIAAAFLIAAVLAGCAGGGNAVDTDRNYQAERLVIRDFIGTLTVITSEPGGDIAVHVEARQSQMALLPMTLSGGELTIEWEGEPDRTRRWWEFWRGRWMADLNDLGRYPTLVVTVPADVEIEVENIIGEWTVGDRTGHLVFGAERGHGTIGATQTAEIGITGDADVEIGPVSGQLDIAIAGSGNLIGDTAGLAKIAISGSGGIALGNIAGPLAINVSGSGDATIGNAASAEIALSGSGRLRLATIADGFVLAVEGSGNVTAAAASGAVEMAVSGSGSVRIEGGRATSFEANISGSGSVRFAGTAVDPVANISGSGGLVLGAVEGDLTANTTGSGRVEILN
jgi:hypothetical protein